MKILTLLILLSITAFNSFAQTTRTIFSNELMYGKVKEIREVVYIGKRIGRSRIDTMRKEITFFDEQGNTVKHETFSPSESIVKRYYVENFTTLIDSVGIKTVMCRDSLTFVENYDKAGNATDRYYFNKEGNSGYKVIYSYDDKNNLIQELHYQNNNLKSTRKHRYDKHNCLIETRVSWSNTDPQLLSYSYEKFDENQNWIKRIESFETARGHIFKGPVTERTIIYYP